MIIKCINRIKKIYGIDDVNDLILEINHQCEIFNKLYYIGSTWL